MMKDHVDRMLEEAGIEHREHGTLEVLSRLFRVTAFVEKRLADAYATAKLNRGEADVLNALLRAGDAPQSPTKVAASLMCSSGAMTNRLDRLEDAGLIRREHGTEDRRSILLSLTAEGKEAVRRANAAREAIAGELLPGLGTEERRALVGLLRRALIQFEAETSPAA